MVYYLHSLLSWLSGLVGNQTPTTSTGTFEIYRDSADNFRFRLKAPNSQIILASESYTTKASAKKGVASVKKHAPHKRYYRIKTASNGEPMFNLKAANHEIIGTSETYSSMVTCQHSMDSVKCYAPNASVVDVA